jgi:hypothetical protein
MGVARTCITSDFSVSLGRPASEWSVHIRLDVDIMFIGIRRFKVIPGIPEISYRCGVDLHAAIGLRFRIHFWDWISWTGVMSKY